MGVRRRLRNAIACTFWDRVEEFGLKNAPDQTFMASGLKNPQSRNSGQTFDTV
jgi:hypothetical protein